MYLGEDLLNQIEYWQDKLKEFKREMAKEELHRDVMRWKRDICMCEKHLLELHGEKKE